MTYKIIGCTIQPENISAVILDENSGKVLNKVLDKQSKHFDSTLTALKNNEHQEAIKYLMGFVPVLNTLSGQAAVEIKHGVVFYNGSPLENALTDRMLRMLKEGFDINPLSNFLVKVMQNPSATAVRELYLFLEANELALTEDGDFLAYKSVNENFTSIHDGKTDNSIGSTVSMPRNMVDDNRERTCSHGLHFASLDYCKNHFRGDKILALKINPKNVVSIPSDYNNQKGRACEYFVLAEVTDEVKKQNRDPLSEKAVFFGTGLRFCSAPNNLYKNQPKRDSKGRFTK